MNTLIIVLIFGSLLLLSFLLISNPIRVNKKANFWFGIFTFLWATFWIEEILNLARVNPLNNVSSIILTFFQFLTPLVFYFSTVYYSNPDFKFKRKELIYLIMPLFLFIGLIIQQLYKNNDIISLILNILVIIQATYFIILSYIKIQQHKKRVYLFSSNVIEIDLKWLEYIIYALLVLSLFIGIYNMVFRETDLNLLANIVSIVIIFFIAFNTLKQKEIFSLSSNQRNLIITTENENAIEKRKVISDKELNFYKMKLTELMEQKKPYLDSDLSLVSLAKLIKLSPHQLSYLINVGFDENFFWFVNKYRVERVKELLTDTQNNHLSILGIAFESGFNSKTSFNTTFKKICSQTPSQFKKSSSSL